GGWLLGMSVDFVGTAKRVEHYLGDAAAAYFADLRPDAIDDNHVAATERNFPAVVEPVVQRGARRQIWSQVTSMEHLAKLAKRDAPTRHQLVPGRIDVPWQTVELVLDVAD